MSGTLEAAEVARIAALARLALSDEELEHYARDLSAVLDHVAALADLDTAGVRPAAHAIELSNVFRPDEVRPGIDRAEVLAAAPLVEDERFAVPRILGEAP